MHDIITSKKGFDFETTVQVQLRLQEPNKKHNMEVISGNQTDSDTGSDSVANSDGNRSDCTNPYLERLLDQYFPSDEEDYGCEADGEYEYDAVDVDVDDMNMNMHSSEKRSFPMRGRRITGIGNGRSSPTCKRSSPSVRRLSPLRSNITTSRRNNRHRRLCSKSSDNACEVAVEDKEGKHHHRYGYQHHQHVNGMDTNEWLQEAQRQYIVGEVKRQREEINRRNGFITNNVEDDEDADHQVETRDLVTPESLPENDQFNNDENLENAQCYSNDHDLYDEDHVRKSLFTSIGKTRIDGVMSLKENNHDEKQLETDTDNDDDLELTYRARQIQHDLRLQEMKELAVEAERAAEEGKEKFVGNATRFGVDDTLSEVSKRKSPRKVTVMANATAIQENWPNCGKLASNCQYEGDDYDAIVHSPRLSTMTYKYASQSRLTPKSELKRPKLDRLSSAPSKLQNRNPSPSIVNASIVNVPSTVSSILTAKSFLSLTQSKFNEKKVPVLSLRHIEEVIPSFGEMHPFVRSHMIRAGVVEKTLLLQKEEVHLENDKVNKIKDSKEPVDEKESAAGSRTSSNSLFPRIQSFQKLFPSFSGLSVEGIEKQEGEVALDSDFEIGSASEAEKYLESCAMSVNADCASLVSCGESSYDEDILQKYMKQRSVVSEDEDGDSTSDIIEKEKKELDIMLSQSDQSDIYVCTLASEIHSPTSRPRSPPIPPPYSDIDINIKEFLETKTPASNGTPPRSRWTTFWSNISPTRNLTLPVPRRAKSLIRAQSLVFEPQEDRQSYVKPKLVKYQSEMEPSLVLRPRMSSESWSLGHHNNLLNGQTLRQKNITFNKSISNSGLEVDMVHPPSTRSLKTIITQRSSSESESEESAFSIYSKPSTKVGDTINQQNSDPLGSSMQSIKENHNLISNSENGQQSLTSRDIESATKPPLHPAGVRLATVLLNNVGIKNGVEGKEQVGQQKVEEFKPITDTQCHNRHERAVDKTLQLPTADNNIDLFQSDSLQITVNQLQCPNDIKEEERRSSNDDGVLSPPCHSEMKRENSLSSIHSYILGEGSSICGEEPSMQVASNDELSTKSADEVVDDDNNNSISSFMDLMENVKVPSVIERLSPLLGGRKEVKNKSAYQDDAAFVGNYFYVGVGHQNEEDTNHVEPKYNRFQQKRSRFCERAPCVDAGCEDFGTTIIEQTFNLLSTKSSWDKESGPLINDPQSYDTQPWLKKALSQCAGHQRYQRREEVIIGEKRFRAPNLQIQKGGFFSRREEDEIHDQFKVSHKSLLSDSMIDEFDINPSALFPGIEIGPIKEDNDQQSVSSINYIVSFSDAGETANYKEKMKRPSCKSILSFSDDEQTDAS
jgi:hypothetical protein